mmetsp:Transcript_46865/g.146833  ORF Transcript_46865/g.146833 Transcript_46865/m.146833 type:complete len:384 (-) Transcript_46865:31-1182(-)
MRRLRCGRLGFIQAKLRVLLRPLPLQLCHRILARRRRPTFGAAATLPRRGRCLGSRLRLGVRVLLQTHVRGPKAVVVCIEEELHQRPSLDGGAFSDVAPVAVDPVLTIFEQGLQILTQVLQGSDPAKETLPLLDLALDALLAEHWAVGVRLGLGLRLIRGGFLFLTGWRRRIRRGNLWPFPGGGLGRCVPIVVLVVLRIELLGPPFWQSAFLLLGSLRHFRWHPTGLFAFLVPVIVLAVLIAPNLLPTLRQELILGRASAGCHAGFRLAHVTGAEPPTIGIEKEVHGAARHEGTAGDVDILPMAINLVAAEERVADLLKGHDPAPGVVPLVRSAQDASFMDELAIASLARRWRRPWPALARLLRRCLRHLRGWGEGTGYALPA